MIRTLIASISGLALLASASLPAFAADTLVISTANPPQHMATRTMQKFADDLMERSGGALKADIFDSSQL